MMLLRASLSISLLEYFDIPVFTKETYNFIEFKLYMDIFSSPFSHWCHRWPCQVEVLDIIDSFICLPNSVIYYFYYWMFIHRYRRSYKSNGNVDKFDYSLLACQCNQQIHRISNMKNNLISIVTILWNLYCKLTSCLTSIKSGVFTQCHCQEVKCWNSSYKTTDYKVNKCNMINYSMK